MVSWKGWKEMVAFSPLAAGYYLTATVPGSPDLLGLFRQPVVFAMAGAAAVLLIISIVSVIRRK